MLVIRSQIRDVRDRSTLLLCCERRIPRINTKRMGPFRVCHSLNCCDNRDYFCWPLLRRIASERSSHVGPKSPNQSEDGPKSTTSRECSYVRAPICFFRQRNFHSNRSTIHYASAMRIFNKSLPKQQKINEMNGAHLASPIRGELGYAHWPQLGSQIHSPTGNQIWGRLGKDDVCPNGCQIYVQQFGQL